MTEQVNLGERLRAIREARLAAERAHEEARVRAAYEKREQERVSIRRTWYEYVSYVITQIDQGKEPKPRKLPEAFCEWNNLNRYLLTHELHTHHDVWKEMQAGAAQLGLVIHINHCHDGVGISSWYEISVEPA